jgi:hypothetical protein
MKIVLPLTVMILWRKRERIFAIAGAVFWIGAAAFLYRLRSASRRQREAIPLHR